MSDSIVLDTHVWFWLLIKHDRLNKPNILNQIYEAHTKSMLFISAITIWELGMLFQKDRIRISGPPMQWINNAIQTSGVQITPLHPEISISSSYLRGSPPNDPADRMIIASTQFLNGRLISADSRIIDYCKKEKLNFIPVK